MNNINKIIRMASVGAALAVVFTIAFATPASAHAQYYGGSNYNISFLIKESDKKAALQSLSDLLFNKK